MAATLGPLESVEVSDDASESNAGTGGEEDDGERAWGDWRVRIGAIFLGRPNPRELRIYDEFVLKDHSINTDDLEFPIGPASDVSLRLPGSVVDLDFRYFGVSQATADSGPLAGKHFETRYIYARPFYNLNPQTGQPAPTPWEPPPPIEYVVETPYQTRVSLSSSLQSAELNLRREIHPSIAVLTGFRYVQFRERWAHREDIYGMALGAETISKNELFGWQSGAEALLYSFQRLRLEGALKAGIFGNAASSRNAFSMHAPATSYNARSGDRRGAVAIVGDINLSASVQLTRNITVRGGYQLLWLAGVSSAMDQQGVDGFQTVTRTDGSMFFHGAMVGLECGW